MAVDAVPRDIEDAVLEPFDRNVPGREGCVLDLGERLHPADALGLLGPEPVGILDRACIHLLVLGLICPGALGPFRRYIINFLGHLTPSTHAPRGKADTASRLHCYNDYASGRPAPTSGTNTTFGEARLAQDQVGMVKRGRRPAMLGALPGHHDRVAGWSKRRMADLLVRLTVTGNRSLRRMGWRSRQLPPKWPPRA